MISPLIAERRSTDLEIERSAVGVIVVETVLEVLFPVIGSKVEPVIEAEL
jgi:hypothetical protein